MPDPSPPDSRPHRLVGTLLDQAARLQCPYPEAAGPGMVRRCEQVRERLRALGLLEPPGTPLRPAARELARRRITEAWIHLYWIRDHLPPHLAERHLREAVDLLQQAITVLEADAIRPRKPLSDRL